MRTVHSDHHVIYLQRSDFGHTQAAATSQADDYQVALRVRRSLSQWRQIGQDGGQFTAGQQSSRVEIPGRE